ncbi:hypothetical protein UA08_06837 [Talaromyces atroroseus]|uniref:Uncharacterized protein n=1 Tax=Talaromyces atroroseus TaxID=1441469 RepID=A0A225AWZ6_TALAT|nr:hypothetical protein UA08_06837 [Talaromyces atroroseus]OKL58017.1 hypothetical protein UA08_06837 [Talaromyces atroroseus]
MTVAKSFIAVVFKCIVHLTSSQELIVGEYLSVQGACAWVNDYFRDSVPIIPGVWIALGTLPSNPRT